MPYLYVGNKKDNVGVRDIPQHELLKANKK